MSNRLSSTSIPVYRRIIKVSASVCNMWTDNHIHLERKEKKTRRRPQRWGRNFDLCQTASKFQRVSPLWFPRIHTYPVVWWQWSGTTCTHTASHTSQQRIARFVTRRPSPRRRRLCSDPRRESVNFGIMIGNYWICWKQLKKSSEIDLVEPAAWGDREQNGAHNRIEFHPSQACGHVIVLCNRWRTHGVRWSAPAHKKHHQAAFFASSESFNKLSLLSPRRLRAHTTLRLW